MKTGFKIVLCLSAFLLPDAVIAEDSQTVQFDQLPPAAQRFILQKTQNKGKLGEIDKSVEDGEVSYDVEATHAGKKFSFSVNADGKLIPD